MKTVVQLFDFARRVLYICTVFVVLKLAKLGFETRLILENSLCLMNSQLHCDHEMLCLSWREIGPIQQDNTNIYDFFYIFCPIKLDFDIYGCCVIILNYL